MNLPNLLTCIRILFVPALVICMYLPFSWANWAAGALFFVAGLTDWLDGFLARKLNQTTRFGAFLDPVADKLIVVISLTLLVAQFSQVWLTLPAMIIIAREITISSLREWMAEVGKRNSVAVNLVGKLKTLLQMAAIFFLLISDIPINNWVGYTGASFLFASALLTLWSMYIYLKAAWPELNPFNQQK